jgi:peptidoglycan-associated lipoprotein
MLALLAILLTYTGITVAQSNAYSASHSQQIGEQSPSTNGQSDARLLGAPELPPDTQREFTQSVKDVFFDFDRAELRPDDRTTLAKNADWLKAHPDVLVTLEGDADERGDILYNLVLSGERANVTRDALIELGVSADRIVFSTGWGELYPICSQADESCWSQNRRTHFATWPRPEEETRVASAVAAKR